MDENIILNAFTASLGSDNEARVKAHEYLQNIRSTPGLIPQLLKISLDSSNSLELRQVAVIYLKNLTKNWKDTGRDFELAQSDKDFLKFHILSGLEFSIHEKIRSQFEEIAHNMTKADYPWEEILNQIAVALTDPSKVYAALNMVYQISRNYEYVMNARRNNLIVLIDLFFPRILELLQGLVSFPNPESFYYVQLILQIYWVSFYIDLPAKYAEQNVLHQWLVCFKLVIDAPLGNLTTKPASEEEEKVQEKYPQWMCKKWAAQIIHRFFTRYFMLNHLRDQNLLIGQYFQSTWAAEFFKSIIPQLFQLKTSFLPGLVLNYYLKYTNQSIKFAPTFALLDENSVSHLLINVVMPILYRVKSDDETWRENPIEFIRKEADMGKAYYSPKSSAIDLLLSLCEKGILPRFFEYIIREMQQTSDLLIKEALLLAFGSLGEQIKLNQALKDQIEGILGQTVFPEFSSQIGFLRSRAAWVYSRFGLITYKNTAFKTQALEAICKLLLDSELPVRYEAALALPKLLNWDVSKERLSNELKNLLEIYLKLMNEIDSEDLVEALESIISAFPKEILPFSIELTSHLTTAFSRMIGKDMNEDEGESAMAAVSTLNTIGKIVDVLEEKPEDLLKISVILKPIFDYCLSEKGADYFEEALNILTCLLYYAPDNSLPHLFYLLRLLRTSILGEGEIEAYALEHIDEIFSPMANFIKKYQQQTFENLAGILEISFLLLVSKEPEAINGCKLLISILENYKGKIDNFIVQIITEVSKVFSDSRSSRKIRIACSQTMFVALWNSPVIALSAGPLIFPSLQYALENIKQFSESLARSHMIYGLGSLFFIIPQIPEQLSSALPSVFKSIVQLYQDLDEDSSVEGEEFEDNNKISVNLDAQCQKIIDKIRASGQNNADDDDDDNEFPYGDNAEDLYDSPFEVLNQNEMIKEIITVLNRDFPDLQTRINSVLTEGEVTTLNSILNYEKKNQSQS